MTQRNFQLSTLAIYALWTAAILYAIVRLCDGHFIYSLDDPYIHLAIAENIARGGYGINLQEYSSPSSSILYPFLLAPFALLGIERLVPLIAGLVCNAVSLWIIAGFFYRYAVVHGTARVSWGWALLIPLLIWSVNGAALPFTGMEHPLHLLAVVLTMTGLVALGETGKLTRSLAFAIVLAPLIRFEGLALSGAALIALACRGRAPTAALLAAVLGVALAIYALFMHRHGLPPLPSSVMVKSSVSSAAVDRSSFGLVKAFGRNLIGATKERGAAVLLAGIVLLMPPLAGLRLGFGHAEAQPVLRRRRDSRALVAATAIAAVTAHILLGAYNWLGRYEVYIFAVLLLAVTYARSSAIHRIRPAWLRIATCGVALILLSASFCRAALVTPAASLNIYEQQVQMHRFVTEYYPQAVAVNDIGAVSYRNDHFVLDLWGLGSEEARKLALAGRRDRDGIAALATRHHVPLAILYDGWFADAIPASWQRVGVLTTSQTASAQPTVTFYGSDPARSEEIRAALRRFAPTLPAGASLVIVDR